MSVRPLFVWVAATAAVLLLVAYGRAALTDSRERVDTARRQLGAVESDIERVFALRARAPRLEVGERPPQDLIGRVHSVLLAAGLPANSLQEVTPQADVPATAASLLRRQSVLIRLKPASPSDLGRFLATWEREQPAWVPTAAEWTHRAVGSTTNLFECAVTVTATYRSDEAR